MIDQSMVGDGCVLITDSVEMAASQVDSVHSALIIQRWKSLLCQLILAPVPCHICLCGGVS